MPSFNIFTPLLLLCLLSLTTKISSQPLSSYCPNSATYTPNSTYHANLNLLLSNLSSNAITAKNGFYNTTAGRSPNIAYDLFLCRDDVINDECQDCVTTASKETLEICPNRTVATVWYDKCLLRYSNRNIFSSMDVWIWIIMYNPQNVTEPKRFRPLLASTMDELATRAASGGSGKKFATKEANFTVFQKLYGLVQCTPDLSKNDCNTCFRDAIARLPSCCDIKLGASILFPSCSIRYEFYLFYTIAPPDTNGTGNGRIPTAVILAIVVAVVVALLLFSIVLWCNVTKARKKYIAYTAIKDDANK